MNKKLKAKIVEHFCTQVDFAEALRIDEAVVSRIVRGRRELTDDGKKQWAEALDCKPEEIFV